MSYPSVSMANTGLFFPNPTLAIAGCVVVRADIAMQIPVHVRSVGRHLPRIIVGKDPRSPPPKKWALFRLVTAMCCPSHRASVGSSSSSTKNRSQFLCIQHATILFELSEFCTNGWNIIRYCSEKRRAGCIPASQPVRQSGPGLTNRLRD